MDRLMNDEKLARAFLAAFLGDLPRQIAILKAHVDCGEAGPAGDQACKIKAAASNVSAAALSAVALEMEKAGRAGDVDALKNLTPELEARFAEVEKAIRAG